MDRLRPCNKTGGEKVFRDGLDRKLIFTYTMKMSTKQSSKTGIFFGDIGPESLFVDDLDGIL